MTIFELSLSIDKKKIYLFIYHFVKIAGKHFREDTIYNHYSPLTNNRNKVTFDCELNHSDIREIESNKELGRDLKRNED